MNHGRITATLEDYLEAIYGIISEQKVARSMDIAGKLGVKRPTVTVALKSLADKGYINYEPRSYITLTQSGLHIAECVHKRHKVLREVFTTLFDLTVEEAEQAACTMEHGMNTTLCKSFTSLLQALEKQPDILERLVSEIRNERDLISCAHSCKYGNAPRGLAAETLVTEDLNSLASGESGKILRILGHGPLKKRLREMGITAGQTVSVIKAAPLDDPIEIKIRNYNLSLRRDEAANIIIEKM